MQRCIVFLLRTPAVRHNGCTDKTAAAYSYRVVQKKPDHWATENKKVCVYCCPSFLQIL